MSEHENTSGGTEHVSPVVMVESNSSKNISMSLTRPNEMRDEAPDLHQKSAPAIVASLAEKLKGPMETAAAMDLKESNNAMSTQTQKPDVKKFSSNISSKRHSPPAVVPVTLNEPESKQYEMVSLSVATHPVPPQVVPTISQDRKKDDLGRKSDEDSITSEIAEMQTPEVAKKSSEWSEDDEAGGLSRTESLASRASRASRVVRAVRQLLCCGVRLQPPSEDNMSSPRSGVFNSGI